LKNAINFGDHSCAVVWIDFKLSLKLI